MNAAERDNPNHMIPQYFENPLIRPYLKGVRDWQGYLRFLAGPGVDTDIQIDRLYVAPILTAGAVPAAEPERTWTDAGAQTVTDTVARAQVLLVLGESGSGKTALLNHLAWEMGRPARTKLIDEISWHLPLPMVLRELPLDGVCDFDGLREAFLAHDVGAPLRSAPGRAYLDEQLGAGTALVLLDGLDEAGGGGLDGGLRDALLDGMTRYPRARWVLSARTGAIEAAQLAETIEEATGTAVDTRHIAPFDESRVALFTTHWYARSAPRTEARKKSHTCLAAVRATPGAAELAALPHTLTMMLAHHGDGDPAPQSRQALYDGALERYLERNERLRAMRVRTRQQACPRRWLAGVALQMQRRRGTPDAGGRSGLMVGRTSALAMIAREMRRTPGIDTRTTPEALLDAVATRSGLLLPRGDDRYTFIHASLQEHLAAEALEREVTGLRWARREPSASGVDHDTVAAWGRDPAWDETIGLTLARLDATGRHDWADELRRCTGRDTRHGGGGAAEIGA